MISPKRKKGVYKNIPKDSNNITKSMAIALASRSTNIVKVWMITVSFDFAKYKMFYVPENPVKKYSSQQNINNTKENSFSK